MSSRGHWVASRDWGAGLGGLGGFTELVRGRIAEAEVAHFDETGLRVQDKLRWVHSASTGKYSLVTVHDHRGTKAMNAAGVLPGFAGVACHDAWARPMTPTPRSPTLCATPTLAQDHAWMPAAA